MKSVCLFSSYFNNSRIPYYVQYYLENLTPYFTETIFITNNKTLDEFSTTFLKERNIALKYVENEGWDFGMWYKAFQEIDLNSYDRVGLINDSCLLFRKPVEFFNWLNSSNLDYCGMVDSNAVAYHVQSFFLIINKKAIKPVAEYFKNNGILKDIKDVIRTYEVGLSQHLIKKDLKVGSFYSTKEYSEEFSPMFAFPEKLIGSKVPLIKKKIIFCSFRKDEFLTLMRMNFNINPQQYISKIKRTFSADKALIDFNKVYDVTPKPSPGIIIQYNIKTTLFQFLRKFKILKR